MIPKQSSKHPSTSSRPSSHDSSSSRMPFPQIGPSLTYSTVFKQTSLELDVPPLQTHPGNYDLQSEAQPKLSP